MRPMKILMVEDDLDLCQGWAELFDLIGHEVVYFQSAADALRNPDAVKGADVVISDFYLPDMNGVELITRIRRIRPDVPCALLTGSKESTVLEGVKRLSNCRLLHKPINVDEIESYMEEIAPTLRT